MRIVHLGLLVAAGCSNASPSIAVPDHKPSDVAEPGDTTAAAPAGECQRYAYPHACYSISALSEEHVGEVDAAMAELRQDPEGAYPHVLRALEARTGRTDALCILLGEWRRAESVSALSDVIARAEDGAWVSCLTALAAHPGAEAQSALQTVANDKSRPKNAQVASDLLKSR